MKTTTFIKLALSTVILSASAHAVAINGNISINSFGTGPTIDYEAHSVTFGPSPNSIVTDVTGSYVGVVNVKDDAQYSNFVYDPFSGPIDPLWTTLGGEASFSLTAITFIDEVPGTGLLLKGYGIASLNGFSDTVGSWSFSANETESSFNWSSLNSAPANVPDGGSTLTVLGLSILGLGGARRMLFRTKK